LAGRSLRDGERSVRWVRAARGRLRAAALSGVVRGCGGGGRLGVGRVRRSGAGCRPWSELYRGFDGEPAGVADLVRVETRTYR
jgi:hypothetical protein